MSDAAELQARQLLASMRERLTRDPHEALGIGANASLAEIRGAFLELTKTFHPAKYGRMSHDVQRLANEAFLELRAAHDSLAKGVRAAPRPLAVTAATSAPASASASGRATTGPILSRTSTGPLPSFAAAAAPTGPIATMASAPMPPSQRPTDRSAVLARPLTTSPSPQPGASSRPNPAPPPARPITGPIPAVRANGPPAPRTFPAGTERSPTRTPPPATAASPAPVRTTAPAAGPAPTIGTSSVASTVRFGASGPAASGRSGSGGYPAVAKPGAAATIPVPPTTLRPGEPELAAVHDDITRGQWDAARVNLQALIARQPASPRFHSLLAYVKGRKAQLEHRIDEARVELDRALQLDPDLAPAKTALAELFTRRR